MRLQHVVHSLFSLFFVSGLASAEITVYYTQKQWQASATESAGAANYTGAAAYDPTVLNPPAVPDPLPPTTFDIQLPQAGFSGMSIVQEGSFFGFSIEMSVVNQVRE